MNPVQKVFGCSDTRSQILSYLPKRCKSCHQAIKVSCKNSNGFLHIKKYRNYEWRRTECQKMKHYCNWCYFYVFEYN
jgi:hypothetical protein